MDGIMKKSIPYFYLIIILFLPLFAGTGNVNPKSHIPRHFITSKLQGESDAISGPIVLPRKDKISYVDGTFPDTVSYDNQVGWSGQFIQSPGDYMMMMYQIPADAILKGVDIPIYEWGTGDQELTISIHKLSYPYMIGDSLTGPSIKKCTLS